MKIFQTIRTHLQMVGIEPMQLSRILLGFLFFIFSILSIALFVVYLSNNIMDFIQCFCTISAMIGIGFSFATIVLQKNQLFNCIECMENLINKRLENLASKAIYEATDRQVEKICGIMDVAMAKLIPQSLFWSIFAMSIFNYFTTDLGNDALQLPFPCWVPFDWKNPIGYSVACFLQCIIFTYVFISLMIMMSIGIACYLFVGVSLIEDLKNILHSIDENSNTKKSRLNMLAKFTEYIDLHSGAKQTVSIFSKLYQPVFMIFFPRALLALCAAMLFVQLEISYRADYGMALLPLICDAVESFGLIFTCCELSQRISNAFDGINDIIDQYKWYLFPHELKRILPIAMMMSQKPVLMECFGSIACCRDVFAKILKGAFSNFMVLREFIK